MKRTYINIVNNAISDYKKIPVRLYVVIILVMVSFILFIPLLNLFGRFFSEIIATAIVATLVFCLVGVMGVMIAYYRMAPQPLYVMKGFPALVMGIFLAVIGFGFALWGLIYNFTSIFKP